MLCVWSYVVFDGRASSEAAVCVCDVGAESSEKTRRELEVKVSRLQQQVDSVTQQSIHSEHELKLAVQREKLAHDSDIDRLSADKVLVTVVVVILTLLTGACCVGGRNNDTVDKVLVTVVVVIVTMLTRCLSCLWS